MGVIMEAGAAGPEDCAYRGVVSHPVKATRVSSANAKGRLKIIFKLQRQARRNLKWLAWLIYLE
jgi:hypothetical protein